MILLISALNGRFELVNDLIAAATQHAGEPPMAVLALGDIGLYEPGLKSFFRKTGSRFDRPLYFIEGHREDYNRLEEHIRNYADVMTHLRRGEIEVIDGHRFLALGGTTYRDADVDAAAALVSERDLQRCLRHPRDCVDAILTYHAPGGLDIQKKHAKAARVDLALPVGAALARRFHPRLWFFANPRQPFQAVKDGTVYHGVPDASQGFGLLWPDLRYAFVPHRARGEGGLLRRLFR